MLLRKADLGTYFAIGLHIILSFSNQCQAAHAQKALKLIDEFRIDRKRNQEQLKHLDEMTDVAEEVLQQALRAEAMRPPFDAEKWVAEIEEGLAEMENAKQEVLRRQVAEDDDDDSEEMEDPMLLDEFEEDTQMTDADAFSPGFGSTTPQGRTNSPEQTRRSGKPRTLSMLSALDAGETERPTKPPSRRSSQAERAERAYASPPPSQDTGNNPQFGIGSWGSQGN